MARSFNLADLFEIVAAAVPDRTAFVCGPQSLLFHELDQRATQLADALRQRGVQRGHNVGIQLYNSAQYLETFLACCKIGAAPVNVNYRYKADELAYLYASLDLRVLVYDTAFSADVADTLARAPTLSLLIHVGENDLIKHSQAYESLLATGATTLNDPERSGRDINMLCTGGTTGMPKGVMWPHESLFMAALGGGGIYFGRPPIKAPEELTALVTSAPPLRYLACAPMMHGAAMWATLISLFAGHCVVVNDQHQFEAQHVWDIIVRDQVNIISIVGDAMAFPLILALEAEPTRWKLDSLKVFGNGGAAFSGHLQERLKICLPHIAINNGMGSSETGLIGGSEKKSPGEGFMQLSPRPDLAVIDDAGKIVSAPGDEGILSRTGYTPVGYYGDPKKTAETFVTIGEKLWVLTGDRARIDAQGDIIVLGRGSQCINTGGEKVFPEEVEETVRRCPFVGDVMVVGLTDERWGQKVAAVIEIAQGHAFDAAEFDRICRQHLSGYKVPRAVYFAPKLVRSPAGKPDYQWAKRFAEQSQAV